MRFYYGWSIVAIGFVVLMLAIGTTMNSFGMFVLPASEDLGLSRADTNTGIILINLGLAALSPLVGRMLDIYPIRRIMAASAVLFGGSLVALGLLHNIWLIAFVLAVPLALAIAGVGSLTSPTLVARWFQAQRGRAIAIVMMGMSLGTFVMAPTVGLLIESVGWRTCLIALGVALMAIFLVLVPFVRERPGPADIEPGGGAAQASAEGMRVPQTAGAPLSMKQILRMPIFWMLTVSVALSLAMAQTIVVSIVPLGQERGLSVPQAASLLSLLGVMAAVCKLILAWIGDRIDRELTLIILFCFIAVTCAALLEGGGFAMLLICSAMVGLAVGAITPVFLALLADRIGVASFGTANGTAALVMSALGAIGVRFGGEVYDRTGSYDAMFVTFIVISLIAAALMYATKRASRLAGRSAVT